MFGKEKGTKLYLKRAKQRGCRIENYIEKYGDDEGRKLFQKKAEDRWKGLESDPEESALWQQLFKQVHRVITK